MPKDANWASVTLATNSLPDEVVAVAASYDQTLKYGAQTPFSDQLAVQWVGSGWQYDPMHDSIITGGWRKESLSLRQVRLGARACRGVPHPLRVFKGAGFDSQVLRSNF